MNVIWMEHGALWFPPDIHIEPEYIIEQEEEQKGASFKERISQKYDV